MPRLLVITTSYPLRAGAANGVFVKRFLDEMPHDWSITVVTPADNHGLPSTIGRIHVRAVRYAPKRWRCLANVPGGIIPSIRRNPFLLFFVPLMLASLTIVAIDEARRCDVIQANWAISGVIAGIVSRLTGVPYVTTLRGDDANRAKTSTLFRYLFMLGVKGADAITAVSASIADQTSATFPDVAGRVRLIANGVQDDFLAVAKARFSKSLPDEVLRILTVSHLIPRKAVEVTLAACERLSHDGITFVLTVAGEGPERSRLEADVASRGLGRFVTFVGHVDPEKVIDLAAEHDVFVLASRSEGRANVLIEAMAAGMAVVATDIPGTRELVRHGESGLLFPVDDDNALAAALTALSRNPPLRMLLGKKAWQSIEERGLLWQNTAAAYDSLFREVIASHSA